MKRNRRHFTAYEMEVLRQNPYTYRVRARQLLFTAEFKEIFWKRYEAGEDVQAIFESMGYEPLMVGYTRMHSVPQNLRKVVEAGREFTDGYSKRTQAPASSGAGKEKAKIEAAEMRHEIAYLRQHVEFLKKSPNWGTAENGAGRNGDTKLQICLDPRSLIPGGKSVERNWALQNRRRFQIWLLSLVKGGDRTAGKRTKRQERFLFDCPGISISRL